MYMPKFITIKSTIYFSFLDVAFGLDLLNRETFNDGFAVVAFMGAFLKKPFWFKVNGYD